MNKRKKGNRPNTHNRWCEAHNEVGCLGCWARIINGKKEAKRWACGSIGSSASRANVTSG